MVSEVILPLLEVILPLLEWTFIIIFTAEAALKMIALRPSVYFGDNWNRFDFFCVATALYSLVMEAIGGTYAAASRVEMRSI